MNELFVAFVNVDGPAGKAQQITSMTGSGLTWSRVVTAIQRYGTTEIWEAYATERLTNVGTEPDARSDEHRAGAALSGIISAARANGDVRDDLEVPTSTSSSTPPPPTSHRPLCDAGST